MTEPPEAAPTMNDLMRAEPPKHDIFAKYHVEDTEQDTENTEPKETDQ